MNSYEFVYKYLNKKVDEEKQNEQDLPEEERVNYYVKGNGIDIIESIVFDLEIFDIEYKNSMGNITQIKTKRDAMEFLKQLTSIEICPEESDEIDISEGILHIIVRVKQ